MRRLPLTLVFALLTTPAFGGDAPPENPAAVNSTAVLFDSNRDTERWKATLKEPGMAFTIQRPANTGESSIYTITKTDKTATWAALQSVKIPIAGFCGKSLSVSASVKVQALELYGKTNPYHVAAALKLYTADGAVLVEREFEQLRETTDWKSYALNIAVPDAAATALLYVTFGQAAGEVLFKDFKLEYTPVRVTPWHSPNFETCLLAQRKGSPNEAKSVLKLQDGGVLRAASHVTFDDSGLDFEIATPCPVYTQPYRNDEIWKADSIQMAFDPVGERATAPSFKHDYEIGFTAIGGKEFIYPFFVPPDYPFRLNEIQYAFSHAQGTAHYQIHLPWTALAPGRYEAMNWLGYDFLVNADGGTGRREYFEWTPGIGNEKNPSQYGLLFLDKTGRGIAAEFTGIKSSYYDKQNAECAVTIAALKDFQTGLSLALNGEAKVSANYDIHEGETRLALAIPSGELKVGENSLSVQLRLPATGETLLDRTVKFSCASTADMQHETEQQLAAAAILFEQLRKKLEPFEKLADKPRELFATLSIAELFLQRYIREDLDNSPVLRGVEPLTRTALALDEVTQLQFMLKRALQQLEQGGLVLSHEKSVQSPHLSAGSMVNAQGQPIYLLSYHYAQSIKHLDYAKLRSMGINMINNGAFGGACVVEPKDAAEEWKVNADAPPHRAFTDAYIQSAADQNFAVEYGIFVEPRDKDGKSKDWLAQLYPDSKAPGNHFLDYDPDHPRVREFYDKAFGCIFQTLAKKPRGVAGNIVAFDLHNEPAFGSITAYTLRDLRGFLEKKYTTIATLNAAWQTSFADFASIDNIRPLLPQHNMARYDWSVFNMDRFCSHFERLAKIAAAQTAGVACNLCIKLMNGTIWTPSVNYATGYDRERLMKLTQINGADNWIGRGSEEPYALTWRMQTISFDFCKALAPEQPIIDSEWHAVDISSTEQTTRAALWLGAWHGLNGSSLWCLTRDPDMYFYKPGSREPGAQHFINGPDTKPRVMEAYSQEGIRIGNDMERIRKFYEAQRPVRLYYSLPSAIFDGKDYHIPLESAYQAFFFQDVGLGFVTERMLIEKNAKLSGLKLLIVPNARYVDAHALPQLQELSHNGVRILLLGGENFSRGLDDQPIAKPELAGARELKLGKLTDYAAAAPEILAWAGVESAYKLSGPGNAHPQWVEARFAELNGKPIGYAINLGAKSAEIQVVKRDGAPVRVRDHELSNAAPQAVLRLEPLQFVNFDIDE